MVTEASIKSISRNVSLIILFVGLTACRPERPAAEELPTVAAIAVQPAASSTFTPSATAPPVSLTWTSTVAAIPPTWTNTPPAPTLPPATPYASATLRPTFTPWPTPVPSNTLVPAPTSGPATATVVPAASPTAPAPATGTAAPAPSATFAPTTTPLPPATATLPPATGGNLLPNPSFEGGWYHINGIPELQIPLEWRFVWEEGTNPLDPDAWNAWVRPEVRVLTTDFLPPHEHPIFIWEGTQTVKIFKGTGSISFRLETDITLPPGRYRLTVNVFPDLVVGYTDSGEKIWAPDPLSGEIRLIAGGLGTGWLLPTFGQRNTLTHEFVLGQQENITVGAAMRGRWAILNNGWFMDHWSLVRVGDS